MLDFERAVVDRVQEHAYYATAVYAILAEVNLCLVAPLED